MNKVYDSSIVLLQKAGSKRIHAIQGLQKKVVLFINLSGKGLTQEINGHGGSIRWAPENTDCCLWSNYRIPCHSKLYPLKSGHLATQLVHAYVMFLKGEVAFFFQSKDYCFGTLIKARIKFLCSVLFPTWKQKHNVEKPIARPRSYLAPSLASSRVAW